jgi:lipid-A-disaccharide synthase
MKLFFSVGEPSGDLHGANLISRLKERAAPMECIGFGGPRMAAAGLRMDEDLTQHAVMGFFRVVKQFGVFLRLLKRADAILAGEKPDAVVLIDFPGFNWWIARRAKARGIPVFYYGTPQIWAWARWRVRKMRRLIDYALCKLPFEETWLRARGCNATYVGHPYFDEMRQQKLDERFLQRQRQDPRPLVAILPGSRRQEVIDNLPGLLLAAEKTHAQVPGVRFAIAAFNERLAEIARAAVSNCKAPVEVHVGRTPELIHLSHCCTACSGSVSLELMHHRKPSVILYRVHPWVYRLGLRLFLKVKHVTLVNLLAEDDPFTERPAPFDPDSPGAANVPFPEYVTAGDRSDRIATHVIMWLKDPKEHARKVGQLEDLCRRYAHPGASSRAADFIVEKLRGRQRHVKGKAA